MEDLVVILVALPLLAALLTQALAGSMGLRVARISVLGSALTFVTAALVLWFTLSGGGPAEVALGAGWGVLLLDPLSSLMGLVISGISMVVHLYSVRYMAEERGYARFFILLDLMTAALLIMVAAGDLLTLLVSWHLIGVFLYLLLGQNTRSRSSYRYGFWTFITYRLGDLPLVLAAVLLFQAFDTWSLSGIFSALANNPQQHQVLGLPMVEVVGALIALAAFARSAQFFVHTWLPYTMDGPTPVSALMHAGIVNAGGFLLNRFAPLYAHTGDVLHWVFIVGLVTAVVGSLLMLTQNDIKKSLGYSTMGQMGFMVMECGLGAFSLAVFHLIAHGLFKGTLFLGAGGIINQARRNDGVPKEDLYTFIVERKPAERKQPWLLMALITLVVPALVLGGIHWLVSEEYFQQQGAIILLFFGWVTGAQLIFATYRMQAENMLRLLALMIFSLIIVVVGYTLISHSFELFLFPDAEFRAQLFGAAGIDLFWFEILIVLLAMVVVGGWMLTYYGERHGGSRETLGSRMRTRFYSLLAREFFMNDLYARLGTGLVAGAARLNNWFRWA